MQGLINTIGRIFDPVLNFFQQVWGYTSDFLAFLWGLIEGLYYGFNTIITYLWDAITGIFDLDFFSYYSSIITYLSNFLGYTGASLFFGVFLVIVFIFVLRFIFGLIPFFHK